MKIGMIGTGAIGGTIAKKLAIAGHEVKVTNNSEWVEIEKRAIELGVKPATIREVVQNAEVVIMSVPTKAISELPKDLFKNVSADVVVIDTGNYYPFRDGKIEDLENGKVESVWVAEILGRPVIKAFNNLLAHTLEYGSRADDADNRVAIAVSGDDQNTKEMVYSLINDAGFDAVDAGTLADSWRHQPGTPAYCTELTINELQQALAYGQKKDAPHLRDYAIGKFIEKQTTPSHEEVLAMNRSLFPKNPKMH